MNLLPVFNPRALYAARVGKGLSRGALAGRSGISRETIRRIELGHFAPQARTLAAIATALDLTPSDLLTNEVAA